MFYDNIVSYNSYAYMNKAHLYKTPAIYTYAATCQTLYVCMYIYMFDTRFKIYMHMQ